MFFDFRPVFIGAFSSGFRTFYENLWDPNFYTYLTVFWPEVLAKIS